MGLGHHVSEVGTMTLTILAGLVQTIAALATSL